MANTENLMKLIYNFESNNHVKIVQLVDTDIVR